MKTKGQLKEKNNKRINKRPKNGLSSKQTNERQGKLKQLKYKHRDSKQTNKQNGKLIHKKKTKQMNQERKKKSIKG